MRRVLFMILISVLILGCTKNNFIDTGISVGRYEGNLLEYMEAHPYDWDSTLVMVHHAGIEMERIFKGEDPQHKEITFFGITNHSIRRYLLENNLQKVTDLDPGWCKTILLHHIVDGKYYRKDIPVGKPGDYGTIGSGGIILNTLAGSQLWVYIVIQENEGIIENASKPVFVNFQKTNQLFAVASADIEPNNCVVHALEYKFTLGDEE